ncbi:TauD/TfdA family dioxygenase [Pseudoalteromonas sp. SMS1]|uniref:TauD/TfdA family dioxygenase n=1 Tax=Pseudoalteromonas sp. SMS1 TaxID=2908894 RepID=UPI001F374B85|nr:TauD/TfdA family dioxygenase [Pseudoalteromonas sp. SMS1]MCF2857582.1 TauD/TfdA family dioxygenase [Pseudoalteromonas sp. SMS1]
MLVPLSEAVSFTHNEDIECGFISETQVLPLVIINKKSDLNIDQWFEQNREVLIGLRQEYGAILFRGFGVESAAAFESFVDTSSGGSLDTYQERQLKRDRIEGNVFTSTAHPKEGEIFLHNEQSFNLQFPRFVYFNCHKVAPVGGATPLADTRKVFNAVPEELRNKLIKLGYMYRRNFMPNLYCDWKWAFQSETQEQAEEYFKANEISWKWHDKGLITLSTEQVRPVALAHPETGEKCWFNHCTSFNVNTIEPRARQFLKGSLSEHEYPNHTYYGDGTPISEEDSETLKQAYLAEKVTFQWVKGDVLMVDNLSVAHAREPFDGDRLVLTAFSDLHDWKDTTL